MNNLHIFGANNLIAEAITINSNSQNIYLYSRVEPFYLSKSEVKLKKVEYVYCDYRSNWVQNYNFVNSLEGENSFVFLQSPFPNRLLFQTSVNEIDQDIETGLMFNLKVTKKILGMKQNDCNFVFFSSELATRGATGSVIYGTIKSGIEGFSKNIAAEYGILGIRSNVIKLGYLDSGFALKLKMNLREHYKKNNFLSKSVDLNSIVTCLKFLNDAKSVTGSIINIDCGL